MRTIVLLFLIAGVLRTSTALAQLPAGARTTVDDALKGVELLAKQTRTLGTMPKWSEPAGRAALAKMWDAPAILGSPPYSAKDLAVLLDITPKEGAVLKSYLLFSPKAGSPPDLAANAKTYEDEIARSSAFMIRINSVELSAIADFMAHLAPEQVTEIRLKGLRQVRLGMFQELTGATMIIRSGDLKQENKAIIVAALADGAEALATASPPADRVSIIKTIEPTLPLLNAEQRSQMQGFITAMQRTDCSGLCAMK